MTTKQKINYASQLAVHPLIAEHPLYKSILSGDMEKFYFVENDFASPLTMVPTYYKYIPAPHCIVIEDYITLFFPHIHNGSNYKFDYKSFSLLEQYRKAFESDHFRGVVCHMRQTLDSISTIFGNNEKINKKLFYLPLAYDGAINKIKPTNKERIVLTFTNSFGGQKNNFPLRGGMECLLAFKQLYETGYTELYLNLTGEVKLEKDLLEWFQNCPNVNIFEPNTVRHDRKMLTEETIHDILVDTDIFLIPACRIHSMSVVRSLCYGNIVIGSNGWGFDEFLDKDFQCDGQQNSSYIEDGVLKEKYSLFLEQPNDILLQSIKKKITDLVKNTKKMDDIKKNNLVNSKKKFNKFSRDKILEDIINKMMEN
jgi:hypothetical protein